MTTILVVAAHADDEVLGCGGTIAKHVSKGDTVHLVIMADGVSSRLNTTEDELRIRHHACRKAAKILGIESIKTLGLRDNQMDTYPFLEVIKTLETVLGGVEPNVIYTHHHGDLNIDHRLTHSAVMTLYRPFPNSTVKEIFGFEVLSSTNWSATNSASFRPSLSVDISNHLDNKMKAIKAYGLEMRAAPHCRSYEHVEALARHRGFDVGFGAAEAFEIYRMLR